MAENLNPNYKFSNKYKTMILLNADNGYGLASCRRGLENSLDTVRKYLNGYVSVINSSHCGCLASSVIPIVKKGFIVFGFTHADSLLLSHGSKSPYFGTNPYALDTQDLIKNLLSRYVTFIFFLE